HYPIMKNAVEYLLKKKPQIKSFHEVSSEQRQPEDELQLHKLISRADNLVMDGQYYDALTLYKQILSLISLSEKKASSFKESPLSFEIEKKISDLKSRYSNEIIFQKNSHGSSER
ncbi:MAG TPA: hypothetical protein PKI73_05635, partial [Petrotogaceae bacterium]|nr:hypothetical protein [Petrotogaceae bacterium]